LVGIFGAAFLGRCPKPRQGVTPCTPGCAGRGSVCWRRNIGKPQPHHTSATPRPHTTATFRQPVAALANGGQNPGVAKRGKGRSRPARCASQETSICPLPAQRGQSAAPAQSGAILGFCPEVACRAFCLLFPERVGTGCRGVQRPALPLAAPAARNPSATLASAGQRLGAPQPRSRDAKRPKKSRHGVQGRAAPCPAPRSATARNPRAAPAARNPSATLASAGQRLGAPQPRSRDAKRPKKSRHGVQGRAAPCPAPRSASREKTPRRR